MATSFNGSETVALANNPGGSTLGGTVVLSATSGLASYSGLALNKVASGYTLDVIGGTLSAATSGAIFRHARRGSELIVSASPQI